MKIIFQTNLRENYGTHDWDGEGEVPHYWKNKNGSTYVMENVTSDFANLFNSQITDILSSSDHYYEETVVSIELIEDDAPIPIEHWETPIMISFDKATNTLNAATITTAEHMGFASEIKSVHKKWVVGGEVQSVAYTMQNDDVLDYQGLKKRLNK